MLSTCKSHRDVFVKVAAVPVLPNIYSATKERVPPTQRQAKSKWTDFGHSSAKLTKCNNLLSFGFIAPPQLAREVLLYSSSLAYRKVSIILFLLQTQKEFVYCSIQDKTLYLINSKALIFTVHIRITVHTIQTVSAKMFEH